MDEVFTQLFCVPNLVFMLVIWLLVYGQRRLIKILWKQAETNKLYTELFLPMGPVFTGVILAAISKPYPFPDMFSKLEPRIFLGAVLGLASAHFYRIFKAFLVKSGDDSTDSTP